MPRKASNGAVGNGTGQEFTDPAWAEIVDTLELTSVVAERVTCEVNHERLAKAPSGAQMEAKLSLREETEIPSKTRVEFRFLLDVAMLDANTPESKPLVVIQMVYCARYSAQTKKRLDKDLLERYRGALAKLHVLPFLRAHVADLTLRAGLPPLLLPLFKMGKGRKAG